MPFLPTLRRRQSPVATKDIAPGERKEILLSSYYSDLASAGITLGAGGSRPWTTERAVTEGYQRVMWVFRAVEAISGAAARVPFEVVDGEHVVEDHPLSRVTNEMANPLETSRVFRKRLSAQVLLSPRGAFVEVTTNRVGDVTRLDLLPPGRTRPVPGNGETLIGAYEVTSRNGARTYVAPEKVRWVREPHPTDLYGASTPLEAAGLSVELNHFARLYNASFMRNDGRPGGILGVETDMLDEEMDRLEARFGRGPVDAGKLSVVGGGITYVDTSRTPRDGQYIQTTQITRDEILVAFGTPESVIGNTAGRTFSNADADGEFFWTVTMQSHLDTIASAFLPDCGGYEPRHDLSGIEALSRPARERRAEARTEFEAGLRSIWSYAQIAGIEGIEDTPHTRALWLPSGRDPVAAQEADAEALAPPTQQGPQPGGPQTPGTDGGSGSSGGMGGSPAPTVMPTVAPKKPAEAPAAPPRRSLTSPTAAPQTAPASSSASAPDNTATAPTDAPKPEEKTAQLAAQIAAEDGCRDRLTASLTGALTALAERQTEASLARLRSPKNRYGTRHWRPERPDDPRVGTKALDVTRAVDVERWQDESRRVAHPLIRSAAEDTAVLLGAGDAVKALLAEAGVERVAEHAARHAVVLAETIAATDQGGFDLDAIFEHVRRTTTASEWAPQAAEAIAVDLIDGIRESASTKAEPAPTEDPEERNRTEEAVAAALLAVAAAQVAQADANITDGVAVPVDPTAFGSASASALRPILYAAAFAAALRVLGGRDDSTAASVALGTVDAVLGMVVASAVRIGTEMAEAVTAIGEATGAHDAARAFLERQTGWASGVAVQAVTATIEGATDEVARIAGGMTKVWVSRHDARVRPTHRIADGQVRKPGEMFSVGDALLRFPGDIEGPLAETAGCRCRVRLELAPEVKHLPGMHRQGDHGNRYGIGISSRGTPVRKLVSRGRSLNPQRLDSAYDGPDVPGASHSTEDPYGHVTANGIRTSDYVGEDAPYLDAWAHEDDQWRQDWYAEHDPADTATAKELFTRWDDDKASWEDAWARVPLPTRNPGRSVSPDVQLREEYDLFVDTQYVEAVEACRGNLLSKEGMAAGGNVDDYTLFSGKLNPRNASEELLRFWQEHPRMTFQQFRAQAWRRPSDVAAAEITASRIGNIDTVRRVVMR